MKNLIKRFVLNQGIAFIADLLITALKKNGVTENEEITIFLLTQLKKAITELEKERKLKLNLKQK